MTPHPPQDRYRILLTTDEPWLQAQKTVVPFSPVGCDEYRPCDTPCERGECDLCDTAWRLLRSTRLEGFTGYTEETPDEIRERVRAMPGVFGPVVVERAHGRRRDD